jgi:hypothetical protein
MNPQMPNMLTAEQYEQLPPEIKANLIITDLLTCIDAMIDMRMALNKIIEEHPEIFGLEGQVTTGDTHVHDENCNHEEE